MDDNELQNQKSFRRFLTGKYAFELGGLTLCLISTVIASYPHLIDQCTTGTLLGGIIGFFANGIRKIHEK